MARLTDNQLKKLQDIICNLNGKIPEKHRSNTFWCPKDMDDAGTRCGYTLYAYGNMVLQLFLENDIPKVCHFLDPAWQKYFVKLENGKRVSTWERIASLRNKAGRNTPQLEKVRLLEAVDWDIVLNAFIERAENISGRTGSDGKYYFEREREIYIAHALDGTKGIKIIEVESSMKDLDKEQDGKKPDLIGVRKSGEGAIVSFIEYKCTKNAVINTQRPYIHFRDMCRYYSSVAGNFEECENRNDFIRPGGRRGILRAAETVRGEMVFLFSHIAFDNRNDKRTVPVDTVIKSVQEIIDSDEYEHLFEKSDLKFVMLEDDFFDEKSPKHILVDDLKSAEEFIVMLKKRKISCSLCR